MKETQFEHAQNQLEKKVSELRFRLQHQVHVMVYLQEELAPILIEQREVTYAAFREGEIGYLEYLNSLEQVAQVKYQILLALYEFNVLKLELDYWNWNGCQLPVASSS